MGYKKHPIYGRIFTNEQMGYYLARYGYRGGEVADEILQEIASKFGYNYKILKENYRKWDGWDKLFKELGKELWTTTNYQRERTKQP